MASLDVAAYTNGHANDHFKETAHTFSMQLGSNRVWDYAGENYVHRLALNKVDGKLVEVNNRNSHLQEEKVESLSLEVRYKVHCSGFKKQVTKTQLIRFQRFQLALQDFLKFPTTTDHV